MQRRELEGVERHNAPQRGEGSLRLRHMRDPGEVSNGAPCLATAQLKTGSHAAA